jgi:hypothetical protein
VKNDPADAPLSIDTTANPLRTLERFFCMLLINDLLLMLDIQQTVKNSSSLAVSAMIASILAFMFQVVRFYF